MNETHLSISINLVIAHLLADFVFQSKKMVDNKSWFSKEMFFHIGVVYVLSVFASFLWWQSLIIALFHYLIDGIKIELKKNNPKKDIYWFLLDQCLHLIVISIVCLFQFGLINKFLPTIISFSQNSKITITALAYILITSPVGYLIGIMTKNMNSENSSEKNNEQTENNGLRIGIFERIIILTFVILGQYEAIGFLITGKSLLRFASKDERLKSEYVLLGTMMSYAITILIGVFLNLFLNT